MRLRSMLAVPIAVTVLLTLMLVAALAEQALQGWRREEAGRQAFALFHGLLVSWPQR